jgi:asparagine synthase (glutamine-hydrolysing)
VEKRDAEGIFERFCGIFNHPDTLSYLNKMTHFDMRTLLPALLQVEDRVSMAVSLESRVPLLDPRISELVATMPPATKFGGGRMKHILKESVRNLVPEQIINRRDKMGFPVPLREWSQNGPVRDFIADILLSQKCRERGLFQPDAVRQLIDTETQFGRQIWGMLCIELWYGAFLDV